MRFDVAGCLRTPKGGCAKQIVVATDAGRLRMRWMTAREYARLQGAADFNIAVGEIPALHGFGDGVPAVAWIDRHLLTPVFASAHASPAARRPQKVGGAHATSPHPATSDRPSTVALDPLHSG